MANDQLTNTLLGEYKDTAKKLRDGAPIQPEAMQRYHGLTGLILVEAVTGMWSRERLGEEINTRVRAQRVECASAVAAAAATQNPPPPPVPFTWGKFFSDNAKVLIISGTVIITAAIIFNQLRSLADFLTRVQVTRNIIEVQ